MSNKTLEKIEAQFPKGCEVRYNNQGRKGHGNIATITHFLHRTGEPEKVAAVQLSFNQVGCHFVTVNQLRKYYKRVEEAP